MHEDPIPSVHDLPGYLAIPGFIRIPEIPLAEVEKIENDAESDEDVDLSPLLSDQLQKSLFSHR